MSEDYRLTEGQLSRLESSLAALDGHRMRRNDAVLLQQVAALVAEVREHRGATDKGTDSGPRVFWDQPEGGWG